MSGKQIKLFLVDGTPGGLTTAEITNWTGHVLSGRRSDLADLLKRDEAQRTGVYLLLGDDEAAIGDTRCYIGEADVVADRLRYHNRDVNKDYWDRVVLVTSKDTNLTKSHGRYLESRLISLATQAGRVSLENGTAPPVPALPEADASDMDYFLSQLQIVLPVLGVNAIRVRPANRHRSLLRRARSLRSSGCARPSSASTPRRSKSTASSPCLPARSSSRRGTALARPTAHRRRTPPTEPNTNSCSLTGRSSSRTATVALPVMSCSHLPRQRELSRSVAPATAVASGSRAARPSATGRAGAWSR